MKDKFTKEEVEKLDKLAQELFPPKNIHGMDAADMVEGAVRQRTIVAILAEMQRRIVK